METDSMIDIRVDYWGGEQEYKLELVELQADTLKVIYHF